VQQRLDVCLVLGCNGLAGKDGFLMCNGIENPIVDLTILEEDHYNSLIEFLDDACDLFSSPVNDYNKCVNTLSLLYKNYDAYNKEMLHNVQAFLKTHKSCGIWIMLVLKEDLKNE
jgi:hypothetical protein